MLYLHLLILLTANSAPFHTTPIYHVKGTKYKIGESTRELLPAVIVQDTSITIWDEHFPSIPSFSLGPNDSPSVLIPQPNIKSAIDLAQHLSESGWNAWIDMKLPKQLLGDFSDPHLSSQWYIERMEMIQLWDLSLGDSDIRIAVIDSGIDITHPDLSNKLVAPYDAFSNDNDPSPNAGEYCGSNGSEICDSHGTAVAGISVAESNEHGIIGICPDCSLIPIKLLGVGTPSLSADIASFEHAIANDAAVINNSWGYIDATVVPQPLVNSIQDAMTLPRNGKGAVVVFAGGNDNRNLEEGELCSIEGVLCVSAIDSYERPTAYTNFGLDIDVAAPSATVSIAPNNSITTNFGGTSAAAPVVSGLAGWVLSG